MTGSVRMANFNIDQKLNGFALTAFRNSADAGYISARMANRSQLPVQYFWASQHTGSQQLLDEAKQPILFDF